MFFRLKKPLLHKDKLCASIETWESIMTPGLLAVDVGVMVVLPTGRDGDVILFISCLHEIIKNSVYSPFIYI